MDDRLERDSIQSEDVKAGGAWLRIESLLPARLLRLRIHLLPHTDRTAADTVIDTAIHHHVLVGPKHEGVEIIQASNFYAWRQITDQRTLLRSALGRVVEPGFAWT